MHRLLPLLFYIGLFDAAAAAMLATNANVSIHFADAHDRGKRVPLRMLMDC